MDALLLCFRGEPLREFPLGKRKLEVGRGAGCDIVVHDPEVAERHLLVGRKGPRVVFQTLDGVEDGAAGGRGPARPLAVGDEIALGRDHSLVRLAEVTVQPRRPGSGTVEAAPPAPEPEALTLVVGHGPEARRVPLDGWPVHVGTAVDNDLCLTDRTVSAHHCWLAPDDGDGGMVRDLGSRNGTWVDGIRVQQARVRAGSRLRVGRTDLMVVAREMAHGGSGTGLVAESPSMLRVLAEVERNARLSWNVLVEGESGSGKEGIARALHARGPRASKPFVAMNAGGLAPSLIESELFGHERGAFTGAERQRRGVFEQADGGTLFLDEIGELPFELQARLLRVLETWEVRRVGAESTVRVNVRLVCATHRDLPDMVREGRFREDLYYRIARIRLVVPPLRERPEDLRPLTAHFLRSFQKEVGEMRLSDEAVARLAAHAWPGNVRELKNVLSRAAVQAAHATGVIEGTHVDAALAGGLEPVQPELDAGSLERVVDEFGGNMTAAARSLGIPRSTLRGRLKSLRAARRGSVKKSA